LFTRCYYKKPDVTLAINNYRNLRDEDIINELAKISLKTKLKLCQTMCVSQKSCRPTPNVCRSVAQMVCRPNDCRPSIIYSTGVRFYGFPVTANVSKSCSQMRNGPVFMFTIAIVILKMSY